MLGLRKGLLVLVGLISALGTQGASATPALAPANVVGVNGMNGTCVPEYLAAGVGSGGGLPYKIQGVGTSSTDTPSTRVSCKFYDIDLGSDIASWTSGFKPSAAAYLAVDYTVHTLDSFITCVKVDRLTSAGATVSTGWKNTTGGACA
jgi:hypothetical protein